MIHLLIHLAIGLLTIFGLLNESKKDPLKPYSISNLNSLGYIIIITVIALVAYNIYDSFEKNKIVTEQKNQLSNLASDVRQTLRESQDLKVTLLQMKILQKGSSQNDQFDNTPGEHNNYGNQNSIREQDQSVSIDLTTSKDRYDLLYNGDSSLDLLNSYDPSNIHAQYVIQLIKSGFDDLLRQGLALDSVIEDLKSEKDISIIASLADKLTIISYDPNLTAAQKRLMSDEFRDIVVGDPYGSHTRSSSEGLENLYPSSASVLNELLKYENKEVSKFAAFLLSEISKNTGNLDPKLVRSLREIDPKTDSGYWAGEALKNIK